MSQNQDHNSAVTTHQATNNKEAIMKLQKLSLITAIILAGTSSANSASNAVPVGSNLGYGAASNAHTIFSISANPAWVSGNLHEDNNYGFGITAGIRIKQSNLSELYTNYTNDVEPLVEAFDTGNTDSFDKANDLKVAMNNLILDVRDNFYLQADANFSLPILIANSSFGGIGIELSGVGTARSKLLSSNKPIDLDTSYLLSNPDATSDEIIENGLIVQAALYAKTATVVEAALTYGNQFFQNQHGQLSVGLRAKYMQAKLVKSINSLDKYLTASSDGDGLDQQMADDFEQHSNAEDTETAFGVDLGVQWLAENYMVGLSVINVNSPSFNYNELGLTNDAQGNVEKFYTNQISLVENVTLDPQARLEGTVYSENRHWSFGASYDLNATSDLVGEEYQWATASVSYASSASSGWLAYIVPDVRLGYRANQAGDARSYITPGFTWGFLNIDLGFADFADIGKAASGDPEDMPEAFMANIGVEFVF